MAKTQSGNSKPLAIEILMADHRKVEGLFAKYEKAKEADDEDRQEIAEKICNELTVHATIEEEIFYPWLRENLDADQMEMVEEAQIEHNSAKDVIEQIEDATEVDAAFDAKVKVLCEQITHHVKEEESEIFPAVADQREALDELGRQFQARQAELKEELGMEDDSEPDRDQKPAKRGGDARKAASH